MHAHNEHEVCVKQLVTSASGALGSLTMKFHQAGGMDYKVFSKLYESLIVPICTYGSAIWGHKHYKQIDGIQLKAQKSFLGLHRTAPNIAASGDVGCPSCFSRQFSECYRLNIRLTNMDSHRITKIIYKHNKSFRSSQDQCNIRLFKDLNLTCDFANYKTKEAIKMKIKSVQQQVDDSEQCIWFSKLWDDRRNKENGNKLRLYRVYKDKIKTEQYVLQNMPKHYRKSLAKFRSGTLQIRVETGRYENVPLQDRICKFCSSGSIEDEQHVLIDCELYNDLRYKLFQQMKDLDKEFTVISPFEQFKCIMSNTNVQYVLAQFIFKLIQRRKIHDVF